MTQKPDAEYFQLTILPMGVTVPVKPGQTVMEALSAFDAGIRSDCGGKGRCGKCLVYVEPDANVSPPHEAEIQLLEDRKKNPLARLACQVRILGDTVITLPAWGKAGDEIRTKSEISGKFSVDPAVRRIFIDAATASNSDFYHYIRQEAESACGKPVPVEDAQVLRRLSDPDVRYGQITLVCHEKYGITAAFKGIQKTSAGLAVDIGTTRIAAYLCDFQSGNILATAGILNPQKRFGDDVMSRIACACRSACAMKHLHSLIVKGVNSLIETCLQKAGLDRNDIDEMTVVGNPTMQHIFAGFHPFSLGAAPFAPFRHEPITLRASDLGCDLHPTTTVYLFPMVSGFIGGDTLGCILSDRTHERDEITLIMDIGTNGELVLGNKKELWATSCATGPAFEGAHISCGMRACTGAIYAADIDPSDLSLHCKIFGEKEGNLAMGLCGSGLIDLVAGMLSTGIVLPSGVMRPRSTSPGARAPGDKKKQIVIMPAERSATGHELSITANDIRKVQLAKAAMASGIELLKRRSGISRIDRVVLTGAFGTKFNPESATLIGLLPPKNTYGRLEIIPNAAGLGAIHALLDKKIRFELESIYPRIKTLELAADPDFSSLFVDMIPFPPPTREISIGDVKYGS